jgi:hypothetical protein
MASNYILSRRIVKFFGYLTTRTPASVAATVVLAGFATVVWRGDLRTARDSWVTKPIRNREALSQCRT